ncbi:hypothetical protein NLI96_g12013 [Meripilus lineatus]|uniref:Cytochrome P450 n=1 Tax=Meripilus lineatus TaxID=2056292 RepID=A0AAD5UQV6_9APHY|nr:hypothetical protein NLI96_g12013 [Physisporinus lineatus]
MSSLSNFAETLIICLVSWILWRVFRRLVMTSPLDNIPGPPSNSFWTGNLRQILHRHQGWGFNNKLAEEYGSVVRFHGLLNTPILYAFDPKALHSILLKDQNLWEEPPWLIATNLLLFGPGLLGTLGNWHRRQRKMLNPVFSINHMRFMTPIFYRITHSLRDAIYNQIEDGPRDVDLLDWMTRTALELVGQGGLGYSFDPLVDESPNEFRAAIKSLVPALFALAPFRTTLHYLKAMGPASFRRRVVDILPIPSLKRLKTIAEVLESQSREIFHAKKAALAQGEDAVVRQVGEGKDIMSILLRENIAARPEDRLPEEELLGQMNTLVFAAMDTTSNALSHILYLLAHHQDVQNKARQELVDISDGRDLTYDQLVDLPYLDAICRETLRVYPPVTNMTRTAREDAVLPLSTPFRGVNGKLIHSVPVPKGTDVYIAIRASNRNKALWGSDAAEWKPERWLSPLPDAVPEAHIPGVYSNLMTFGGGGRSCIGFKFSQLEMIQPIQKRYRVELGEYQVPHDRAQLE